MTDLSASEPCLEIEKQPALYDHTHTYKSLLHNLKLFTQYFLNVFKEYKPNMLYLTCMLSIIISLHSGDTACKFFVIPCANIQKESRATQKKQTASHLIGFPHDNAAWR